MAQPLLSYVERVYQDLLDTIARNCQNIDILLDNTGTLETAVASNTLKINSNVYRYYVNPNLDGAYETIEDAVSAADAELPAEVPAIILVEPNITYTLSGGSLTLPKRHFFFRSSGIYNNLFGVSGIGDDALPIILGDLVLQNADAASERLILSIIGITIEGQIFGQSNTLIYLENSFFHREDPFVVRTHGTNGCLFFANNVMHNNGQYWVQDLDTAQSFTEGGVTIRNCDIALFPGTVWLSVRGARISIFNSTILLLNFFTPFSIIDANNTSATVEMVGVSIENLNIGASSDTRLLANFTNSSMEWKDVFISSTVNSSLDLGGNQGSHILGPQHHGPGAPVNPTAGTVWYDTTAFVVKMWNGVAWV